MGGKNNLIILKTLIEIMIKITNKTNEEQIFKIINENFSQLAPSYYSLVTHWFINALKILKVSISI